jgi:hypothetical protein
LSGQDLEAEKEAENVAEVVGKFPNSYFSFHSVMLCALEYFSPLVTFIHAVL